MKEACGTLTFRGGVSPPQATPFSCLAKKRKQKKATPVPASPAACGVRGNLRCSHQGRIAQLAPLTAFVHLEQVQ
jgi:hypothetical protein